MIASILNDFHSSRQLSEYSILDWNNAYNNIDNSDSVIKCGVLPTKKSSTSLIEDFCNKAGLNLNNNIENLTQKKCNVKFNEDVIEAINIAVSFGFKMPTPHQSNNVIESFSSKMSPIKKDSSKFLSNLKLYIDSYYRDSNKQLCMKYNLNETYFESSKRFTKSEILNIIVVEELQRSLRKSTIIEKQQVLSAKMIELAIKLVQKS